MKKVKILSSYSEDNLESYVNEFLENLSEQTEIHDMQFQLSGGSTKVYAVMVTYEE